MAVFKRMLLVLLLCMLGCACTAQAQDTALFEGYRKVTASGRWELYLKESTLGLIIRNADTGAFMRSVVDNPKTMRDNAFWKGFYQSGVVMEYMEGTISKYKTADLVSGNPEIRVTDRTDGFSARVYYADIGIGYTLEVTLQDNVLRVRLPQAQMTEENPDRYAIAGMYVYPFMGYSYQAEHTGFMLIPDGQGALITLKDNGGRYPSPYRRQVYGENIGMDFSSDALQTDLNRQQPGEDILAPYFGMVHTDNAIGYLALIQGGDIAAEICAYPNGATRMNFDRITTRFAYRDVYPWRAGKNADSINRRTTAPRSFDADISFRFVSGENADVAGLALEYRSALKEQNAFAGADADRPFDLWLDILCTETKKEVLGYRETVLTTAGQTKEFLERLQAAGVEGISCALLGWQQGGYTGGNPVERYAPASALGDLDGLYSFAKESGVRMYLDADPVQVSPRSGLAARYNTLQRVDGEGYTVYTRGPVFGSHEYLAPHLVEERAEALAREMAGKDVPGVTLGSLPSLMTDYSYKGVYYSSDRTAESFTAAARSFSEALPLVLRRPNAYLWPWTEVFLQAPAEGSYYEYARETVPFLTMALSGLTPVYMEYVNDQPDPEQYFLQLAEWGARPSFLLMAADQSVLQQTDALQMNAKTFGQYEEMLSRWYHALNALYTVTRGGAIADRDEAQGHVTVLYDNGAVVCVNYTDEAWHTEGGTVPARSFAAWQKGEK